MSNEPSLLTHFGTFLGQVLYNWCMEIVFDEKLKLDRTSWLRLLGVSNDHLKAAETDEKMRAALARRKSYYASLFQQNLI